jgi:hypothetical protein
MNWMDLLTKIVAGLVGTAVLAVLGYLARRALQGGFVRFFYRISGLDLLKVFRDRDDLRKDIQEELKRATGISILMSRGNDLQQRTFAPLFVERILGRIQECRILLPQTTVGSGATDWTANRDVEVSRFDGAYGNGLLSQQIEANARFVRSYDGKQVHLRRFNAPHIGQIVITDRVAYFTPYRGDSPKWEYLTYKYRRDGNMYRSLVRWFDLLWDVCAADAGAPAEAEKSVSGAVPS